MVVMATVLLQQQQQRRRQKAFDLIAAGPVGCIPVRAVASLSPSLHFTSLCCGHNVTLPYTPKGYLTSFQVAMRTFDLQPLRRSCGYMWDIIHRAAFWNDNLGFTSTQSTKRSDLV